jgi:hypothetical protein
VKLLGGKCDQKELSWVTLASVSPGNATALNPEGKCNKMEEINYQETVVLTGVPCNSTVVVYAHDGSYKATPWADVDFLGGCSDNSGENHCGPYGNYVLNCQTCSVV